MVPGEETRNKPFYRIFIHSADGLLRVIGDIILMIPNITGTLLFNACLQPSDWHFAE